MGMRVTKGIILVGVFFLLSTGSTRAAVAAVGELSKERIDLARPASNILEQIDGATIAFKDVNGNYLGFAPNSDRNWMIMAPEIKDDPKTPFKEEIRQIFKAYRTPDGFVTLQSMFNGKNLQVTGKSLWFDMTYRILRAENNNQTDAEKFQLVGPSLQKVTLFNKGANAFIKNCVRINRGGLGEPYPIFDGVLWAPEQGEKYLYFGQGRLTGDESPALFSIEILEESPALIAAREKAAAEAKAAELERINAEKAKAEDLAKKNADELRVTIADLEKKIKALEESDKVHDGEIAHISQVLTSQDPNKLEELMRILNLKVEAVVQKTEAKKEAEVQAQQPVAQPEVKSADVKQEIDKKAEKKAKKEAKKAAKQKKTSKKVTKPATVKKTQPKKQVAQKGQQKTVTQKQVAPKAEKKAVKKTQKAQKPAKKTQQVKQVKKTAKTKPTAKKRTQPVVQQQVATTIEPAQQEPEGSVGEALEVAEASSDVQEVTQPVQN